MKIKILVALLLVCFFAISFGLPINALLQQMTITVVNVDLTFIQGALIKPNGGGGGDPVPGPGVPK